MVNQWRMGVNSMLLGPADPDTKHQAELIFCGTRKEQQ